MTFAQACEYFTTEILPMVREHYEKDGVPDWPARGEAWCNWTDSLCKDGRSASGNMPTGHTHPATVDIHFTTLL